jgi:hypothetical protein
MHMLSSTSWSQGSGAGPHLKQGVALVEEGGLGTAGDNDIKVCQPIFIAVLSHISRQGQGNQTHRHNASKTVQTVTKAGSTTP